MSIEYPRDIPFPTKFGELKICCTSDDHVFISGVVVVNTVETSIDAHFNKYDGHWELSRRKDGTTEYHSLQARRYQGGDDVSFAARKKITDTLTPLVNEWAEKNKAVLRQGELHSIDSQKRTLESERFKLAQRIKEIDAQLLELKQKAERE